MGLFSGFGSNIRNIFNAGSGGTQYQVQPNAFAPNQQEQNFTNSLIAYQQGTQPSFAQTQLQQGLDQSNAQANALAASQQGISPGLAARLAMQAQGANQQAFNQQAAGLRAQEQMGANQQLQQELQSQRTGQMSQQQLQAADFNNSATRANNMLTGIGTAGATFAGMFPGAAAAGGMSHGGFVPQGYAQGGQVSPFLTPMTATMAPQSDPVGAFAQALGAALGNQMGQNMTNASSQVGPALSGAFAQRKKADQARVDGLNNQIDFSTARGTEGEAPESYDLRASTGGQVPGQAEVQGDSPANDQVPAMLSPGELVIPRSVVAQGPEAISAFAEALLKRKGA